MRKSLERLGPGQARYQTAGTIDSGQPAGVDGKEAEAKTNAERAREVFTGLDARLDLEEADQLLARLKE